MCLSNKYSISEMNSQELMGFFICPIFKNKFFGPGWNYAIDDTAKFSILILAIFFLF